MVDSTSFVGDATDTDVRHQVDDSSRVVVEEVEEVEGQVQVAFKIAGSFKTKVGVDARRTVDETKGLRSGVTTFDIVLVARKETITAFEIQANDLTELVTNAKMGIPVLCEVLGNHLEVAEIIPNATVVVGQVTVVDGEATVSLDVPVLFGGL